MVGIYMTKKLPDVESLNCIKKLRFTYASLATCLVSFDLRFEALLA